MADLRSVETRLRSLLDSYRDRLEVASVYGNETLARSGAKAHDFFAFIKPGASYVSLYLKPVHTWPDLLDDISPELRKRLQGSRTAFSFATVDEELLGELEALVERAFRRYSKAANPPRKIGRVRPESAAPSAASSAAPVVEAHDP